MDLLAKKYARAFFNLFKDNFTLSSIEQCEKFVQFMHVNKRALYYVQLSLLSDAVKQQMVMYELHQFKLDKLYKKLVELLTAHKNLFLIADIIAVIIQLYKEYHNRMDVTVKSSHELTSSQLRSIEKFLVEKTGKTIVLVPTVDKELIAGLKLASETLRWEYSVRKQLRALNRFL